LVSLVIGCWAIYRQWQSKITILFSVFCFTISVWAFSFVSHETLAGRLSYDIHLFCNVLLVPIAISILNQILFKRVDWVSLMLQWISAIGAFALGLIILFSVPRNVLITNILFFYPSLILIEYLYGMAKDVMFRAPMNTDVISPTKKFMFYAGLAISLAFCTFDHVPILGYTLPALGNLLLTAYLVFASQLITPQKLLRLEALVSRFLAVVTLALVITGFFALVYDYISETFGLFLLNSFLISFAVLSLWNPLVTFFRYLGNMAFESRSRMMINEVSEFKRLLLTLSDPKEIRELTSVTLGRWTQGGSVTFVEEPHRLVLPDYVKNYFDFSKSRKAAPVLHREILMMERDQAMGEGQRQNLSWLLQFLDMQGTDIVIPSFFQERIILLTCIRMETPFEELSMNLSLYGTLYDILQDVGVTLYRLTRVEEEKEKDRLVLLGEMAAGLAHEVRNPLGAIRGAAELIPDSTNPWAQVIQEEVSRLNRLVSQFLDFAQDPKEQREAVDLSRVARASIQAIKLSSLANISLVEKHSASVDAVPDHVRQVLINLIQNSLKATEGLPEPSIEVLIEHASIVVRDNGIGMSDDVKKKIFQPFFTTFKEGSGLGLSICQRLMSFSGGSMTVQSEAGKGTEVLLLFQASEKDELP